MEEDDILLHIRKSRDEILKLEESSQRIQRIGKNDLEDIFQKIRQCWNGENAEAFLKKCGILQEKINASGESLSAMASSMKDSVEYVQNTDLKMAERLSTQ